MLCMSRSLEAGKTVTEAMVREANEEPGIVIAPLDPHIYANLSHKPADLFTSRHRKILRMADLLHRRNTDA